MSTETIIMVIGLGIEGHFQKALRESDKEIFTKEDFISIHTKALIEFCTGISESEKETKQKKELMELRSLPKFGVS